MGRAAGWTAATARATRTWTPRPCWPAGPAPCRRTRTLPVEGGLADEAIRPLEFSPAPGTPLRAHLDEAVVAADLDRLAAGQRDDGGWAVDFTAYSPAAALEWRGYATVEAVGVLRAHGRA